MIGLVGATLPFEIEIDGRSMAAAFACASAADYALLEGARDQFLHANEIAYFVSLPALRRQRTYLLGRYAAKHALQGVLPQIDPARVEIVAGAFGQPIVHALAQPIDVSISHTDEQACAIAFAAEVPMAIDVERVDERRIEVMKTQLLPREIAAAARAACGSAVATVLLWTAKEALSKALRCGMTCPFELLAVETIAADGRCASGSFRNFTQYRFESWTSGDLVVTIVLPRSCRSGLDLAPVLPALLSV
jgi:4'-phosphopantetheinyl transferase